MEQKKKKRKADPGDEILAVQNGGEKSRRVMEKTVMKGGRELNHTAKTEATRLYLQAREKVTNCQSTDYKRSLFSKSLPPPAPGRFPLCA